MPDKRLGGLEHLDEKNGILSVSRRAGSGRKYKIQGQDQVIERLLASPDQAIPRSYLVVKLSSFLIRDPERRYRRTSWVSFLATEI